MNVIKKLLHALWQQNFETLSEPNLVWTIYFLAFIVIFLENGLLPAAFLPGDSLLVLLGVLVAKGALSFFPALVLLSFAAGLGSWISYLQGKWLKNNRIIDGWMEHLPLHYHNQAYLMFHRYGLSALLIGRFIAFVRTLLPIIAGLSGLGNSSFQFFNWTSAFLWVFILVLIGFSLERTSVFQSYEQELMLCLILLPLILLMIGCISSLAIIWRRK
ncbi:DedA family protein [Sodalis sp. CWE]|uniref:DedA family protein n=1 Tax=Sodalis sp. CWE TaxID=2803816 RepID=UPI001C7D703D|nr:DedA family protein [Sodalis sp. CWE]